MTAIYLAASALDIERAEHWIAKLRAAGIAVTSTWTATIRAVGAANPRDASDDDRRKWSLVDLAELRAAAVFWLLVPPLDKPTRGAWLEVGYALNGAQHVVCSGDCRQSIFCALAEEYETDEAAFAAICAMAARDGAA